MNALAEQAFISLDAFLAWEARQPRRFERVAGVVRQKSGSTANHDSIANAVRAELRARLRSGPCKVRGPDLRVVSPDGDVMYPDAFVYRGDRVGSATYRDDPAVIFAVLSDGTAEHDLTRKRQVYQTIPSLRAIVYLSQREIRAHLVRRDATGHWRDEGVEGAERALASPEVGVELPMGVLYEETDLAAGRPVSDEWAANVGGGEEVD